ncbi:ImmA/IrrE family metallo-endopeptidase, partial [Escherichia coli]|uniref:ImmA/IrrE family metallo-endopeptidase n=10 Tax=Gammaproteobacteria TaxID=1236 RepID=UPI001953F80A
MHTWDPHGREIELEADTFASYLLMPLDDFKAQIDGQPFSLDLLRHCADRYGVSVTAAALKWREVAPGRVIVLS